MSKAKLFSKIEVEEGYYITKKQYEELNFIVDNEIAELDRLTAEVERLKQENEKLEKDKQYFYKLWELEKELSRNQKEFLRKENEQLREALKHRGAFYWDENEQSFICDFCGEDSPDKHATDCEYIQLCKL